MRRAPIVLALTLPAFVSLSAASAQQPAGGEAEAPLRCPLGAPYDPANPFARMIRGSMQASPVYEDRRVMVIVPLGWEHPGHVLVIPKRAVRNLMDMRPAEMAMVLETARRAAVAQQRAFGSTGFTIEQNNGRHQSVCHAHFHVIPNTPAAPVRNATREEMDAIAARLRAMFPTR